MKKANDAFVKGAPTVRLEAAREFMFSATYQKLLLKREAFDMVTGMNRTIGQLKIKGLIDPAKDATAEIDLTMNEKGEEVEDSEPDAGESGGEGDAEIEPNYEFADLFNVDPDKEESTYTFQVELNRILAASSTEWDAAGLMLPEDQIDWHPEGSKTNEEKDVESDTESLAADDQTDAPAT